MSKFKVGDRVKILPGSYVGDAPEVIGQVFTIIKDDGTGIAQYKLDVLQDYACTRYSEWNLELVQEGNIASWEDDYNDEYFDYWSLGDVGTYKVNQAFNETALQNEQKDMFAEDYLSDEYKVHWATKENEDWQERACQNITAVQKAYQEGLYEGKKQAGLEGLAAQCLKTATELHFADELHDNYDIAEFAAKMYKDFLKELNK